MSLVWQVTLWIETKYVRPCRRLVMRFGWTSLIFLLHLISSHFFRHSYFTLPSLTQTSSPVDSPKNRLRNISQNITALYHFQVCLPSVFTFQLREIKIANGVKFLFSFFFLQPTNVLYKNCWWLYSNAGPLVSEAITLPSVPQPLAKYLVKFITWGI